MFCRLQAKLSGTHMFCLDNTFSLISRKVVFFELILRKTLPTGETPEPDAAAAQNTVFDLKVNDFKVRLFDSLSLKFKLSTNSHSNLIFFLGYRVSQ